MLHIADCLFVEVNLEWGNQPRFQRGRIEEFFRVDDHGLDDTLKLADVGRDRAKLLHRRVYMSLQDAVQNRQALQYARDGLAQLVASQVGPHETADHERCCDCNENSKGTAGNELL